MDNHGDRVQGLGLRRAVQGGRDLSSSNKVFGYIELRNKNPQNRLGK